MKRDAELAKSATLVMDSMTKEKYNQLSEDEHFALRSKWVSALREKHPDKALATIRSAISHQLKQ